MTDLEEDLPPGPPPLMELARQLAAERTRHRQRLPKGYNKNEIPRDICSTKTLGRLESGRYRGVNLGTVLNLLRFYRTPPEQTDHIARLAEASKAHDWCVHYATVLEDRNWFYQQCEDSASYMLFHSFSVFPSLIQGRAYYRMLRDTTRIGIEGEFDWEEGEEFRLDRRERWIASERPAQILIGEVALRIDLGPRKDAILADLREVAALSFADVRVIPYSAGRYEFQPWALNLLEYDDGEETVINVESPRGAGFIPADSSRGKFFTGAAKLASGMSIAWEDFQQ
ncbi:Scr1 family TA system antitoxin-like transcriptional regulator [Glycomyces sp. NRRL B-16210]|uniref:Scr1 family TA system antitoxin-like transcriptional regulator n=1 Tax=Glycomyces sp. NRRL B-16210 TaxID=1463821 RepID=UPI001062236C|nr:Scr1 family TA system antitoxin-like transcriptional regulator [Glycomyces sp. NRRL B-16210]